MSSMSEMPTGRQREVEGETGRAPAPSAANACRAITVDVDRKLDKRLRVQARWRGISAEDLLAEAIERYPKASDQRSVTFQVSNAAWSPRLGAGRWRYCRRSLTSTGCSQA